MAAVTYIRRLNPYHRVLHIVMASSFLGLVVTGMPLRYSNVRWASWLMRLLGGYESAGHIHRICAIITFGYFIAHIAFVLYYVGFVRRFRFDFFGPDSMLPRLKDLRDVYDSLRWFLGLGPRPKFDRWTYWEKFDYWAVFWGVAIIGLSGLCLWFPEFFGRFLPGWVFNIATIVHSDEALLAAGFIFTIHFFNTHMRPEKFPMDTVIFTGSLPLDEFRRERPLEYERLIVEGKLGAHETGPPPGWLLRLSIPVGVLFIVTGLFLLVLILLGQFVY
jgi:thiosulfate reductase cytochrome b subunit